MTRLFLSAVVLLAVWVALGWAGRARDRAIVGGGAA